MASYEAKTFKGTKKCFKLSSKAKKFKTLKINCSHYQATVLCISKTSQQILISRIAQNSHDQKISFGTKITIGGKFHSRYSKRKDKLPEEWNVFSVH